MGIRSLLSIVGKDFRIFSRSPLSALVILLVPLFVILFMGYAFNSFALSGIIVGVYSESYTNLTQDILNGFEEQNLIINKFNSQDECISSIKSSKIQICIIFPNDLTAIGSSNDIVFYVDHSRMNIAYALINSVEEKISAQASDLGIALATDLVNVLSSAKNSLPEQNVVISQSISKLNEINDNTHDVPSSSEMDNAITYLNDANNLLDSVNDSVAKKKIEDTITILNSIKNSNAKITENIEDINTLSDQTKSSLQIVTVNIDSLINDINQISVLEPEKIVSPIKTKIESINASSNNRDYLLPTILALIAMFGGILISSTFVLKERKTKAFFRNFITPTWDFTLIFGSYLSCLIILTLQFILVFAGIEWILKVSLIDSILPVSLVLFLSLTLFIFMGMFIGYVFKSEETTIFASVLIAAGLMFFSNTILPIETLSGSFKKFVLFNPLVVLDISLKKIILFDFNYSQILPELYIMVGFIVLFCFLTYIGRKITKRML